MRIDWDIPITMDDGIVLRADVFRPIDDGRYPVIMSHGPYGKGLAFQDGYADQWRLMTDEHPDVATGTTGKYANWEVVDPEKWVPHGYACVRVDSRGAGRSAGVLDLFSPRETADYYTCIEWAAAQEWSNGRVGLNGISYYAINQWQVASLQPPHLAAICAWEGAGDFYRDWSYHGGILSTFTRRWFPEQVKSVQHGAGTRGARSRVTGELVAGPETLSDEELARRRVDLDEAIAAHPFDDEFHQSRSPDWSRVTVPLLSCANWGGQGLHPRGNFEAFMRAASTQKWLECHGLEHWTHFYTDYGRELQLEFFDHFLKGADNGWDRRPPMLLNVRSPGERFTPRTETAWPIPRTRWTRYYLDAGQLTLRAEPTAQASVTCDPAGDGVLFWLPAVNEQVEVTGPLKARLFISSQTQDADLFVVVRVFDPAGHEVTFTGTLDPHTPVAQGWLRASHRQLDPDQTTEWRPVHRHTERELLTPGDIYPLDIEIWPTCIVIPRGHRVALHVRGTDYHYGGPPVRIGWFTMQGCGPFMHDDADDRPPSIFGGRVTIHTGAGCESYLLLPVIPGETHPET
jgi:predicted acyl esterase